MSVWEVVFAKNKLLDALKGRKNFEKHLPSQFGVDENESSQVVKETDIFQVEWFASTRDRDRLQIFEVIFWNLEVVVGNGEFSQLR